MSGQVAAIEFGQDYADAYDAIYRAKDYQGEVDLIERILVRHGLAGPRRLLDLGCGTGSHALPLVERGHSVVGVDRSPAMLATAEAKVAASGGRNVTFRQGDVRTVDLGERFDAVLMMFAVLCYQLEDADVRAALATVQRHLKQGGLFIFDVWNGLAVVADPPGTREVSVNDGEARIVRKSHAVLDAKHHLCRVYFDLERVDMAGNGVNWREEHLLRYYFPDELEELLWNGGLKLLNLRSFPNIEKPADERAWNVIGTAQAC